MVLVHLQLIGLLGRKNEHCSALSIFLDTMLHNTETQALTTCKNNVLMLSQLVLKASMNEWKLIINKAS